MIIAVKQKGEPMDDLISRQAAIDAMLKLQAEDDETYGCRIPEGFDGDRAKETLEQLPSAQPEIIRCKDCRFHEDEQPGMVYCPAVVGGWVEDDWFCKGGERRTDE